VSEHTCQLLVGYFELRVLGPMAIRGISEAINVYAVTGLGSLRTHFELSVRRGLTKFVGRETDLARMKRTLDQVIDGLGQVVAVMAELTCLFVEGGFSVDEVGGVEALGEPVVDIRKHRARLPLLTSTG
jgi:hypothetical protein